MGRGVSPGHEQPAVFIHGPCTPASIQEAPLAFQLHRVPHVAALLLLAPPASTGSWAPAKPWDLHAAQTCLSVQGERAGEITADRTLLCACFLGEQPNLHGKYNLLLLKARALLVQAVGQIQLLSSPAPAFPTATPSPHPLDLRFWLICQNPTYSSILVEEEGGSCCASGRGG